MKGVRLTAPGTGGLSLSTESIWVIVMDPLKQLPQPSLILRVCSTAHRVKAYPLQMQTKHSLGP